MPKTTLNYIQGKGLGEHKGDEGKRILRLVQTLKHLIHDDKKERIQYVTRDATNMRVYPKVSRLSQ